MAIDRRLLAAWLRDIPQSRHDPRPLAELPGGETLALGLAILLQVWGAVEVTAAGIRSVSQPAYYFLHSLAAWAESPDTVIGDWSETYGVRADAGLRHGASLVYLLEAERLARDAAAAPIRITAVAQVLVIRPGEEPRFLAQWDERAGQYQLIGGRQKRDRDWSEPMQATAVREVEEELWGEISHAAGDFRLQELATFSTGTRLSPSFGALTAYHFTFFHVYGLKDVQLGPQDRWLTRDDLLSGHTSHGAVVRGDHILLLEQILGQRIDQLPSSFS